MITVIAGVNGAGKSSVIGSWLRGAGGEYFNPDEATQLLQRQDENISLDEANALAWHTGYDQLSFAIESGEDYTFETTLGGNSITNKLHEAIDRACAVRILYCGLESVELHIKRVAERVARGGHDIPTDKVRQRYESSISNLVSLIPVCDQLVVFDNSASLKNGKPSPIKLLHLSGDRFEQVPVQNLPDWAKPLASVAIRRAYPDS